jgi:hypothetical protein
MAQNQPIHLMPHKKLTHKRSAYTSHSLFQKARHPHLAKLVTFHSAEDAREASDELEVEFDHAHSREYKVVVKRATVEAANRAEASAKRSNISQAERNKLHEVAGAYRAASHRMKLD